MYPSAKQTQYTHFVAMVAATREHHNDDHPIYRPTITANSGAPIYERQSSTIPNHQQWNGANGAQMHYDDGSLYSSILVQLSKLAQNSRAMLHSVPACRY